MSQITITLIIVAAAFGYTVYSVVKSLMAKESGHCGGCDACDIKNDFLKELEKKGISRVGKQGTSVPTNQKPQRFPELERTLLSKFKSIRS